MRKSCRSKARATGCEISNPTPERPPARRKRRQMPPFRPPARNAKKAVQHRLLMPPMLAKSNVCITKIKSLQPRLPNSARPWRHLNRPMTLQQFVIIDVPTQELPYILRDQTALRPDFARQRDGEGVRNPGFEVPLTAQPGAALAGVLDQP